MTRSYFQHSSIALLVVILVLTFTITSHVTSQKTLSSISGKVIDAEGEPVAGLDLTIKPVKFGLHIELKQRTPFSTWRRAVTDHKGRFAFHNIDPVSSQFVIFPEHGSDPELQSIEIGDLTFYSIAFRRAMPTWFGKLTFSVEPGEHLENVIVNVKTPRMRIRGRVLFEDGTPLINEQISLTINSRRTQIFPGGTGGSSGSMTRNFETDNEGYFVTYSQNNAATYTVSMAYKGFFAQSEQIILEEGERYDDLVFILKNVKKMKAREAVWIVNPATGNAYKKIQCNSLKDAKAKAAAENAYLVAINDEAEQKWIERLFNKKAFFWIGLNVPENETPWQWGSGQPLTYTNWRNGDKLNNIAANEEKTGVAIEFSAKKWVAIGEESPFLPAVKHAILEKEGIHVPKPKANK